MTAVLKLLCLSLLLGFCRGWVELRMLDNYKTVCPHETVYFELEFSADDKDWVLYMKPRFNTHVEIKTSSDPAKKKVNYIIYDPLPSYTGYFDVVAQGLYDGYVWDSVEFYLDVPDLHLSTSVKSPVIIEHGGNATLMVNRSDAGDLMWALNGAYIRLDKTGGPQSRLEITDATAEQDGFYEAWLYKGPCILRNIFEVQVQEFENITEEIDTAVQNSTVESDTAVQNSTEKSDTEVLKSESNIYKYLKVFSGDFTGEWYVAPAVLAPIVILFLALIICIIRQKRKEMRSKRKDKGDQGVKRQIVFEEPIYTVQTTVQDQVFYPPADTTYDIAPVTSSHPQSTSLRSYGDRSPLYGMDVARSRPYDSRLGPPVPPPQTGLRQTYSAMSDLDSSDD